MSTDTVLHVSRSFPAPKKQLSGPDEDTSIEIRGQTLKSLRWRFAIHSLAWRDTEVTHLFAHAVKIVKRPHRLQEGVCLVHRVSTGIMGQYNASIEMQISQCRLRGLSLMRTLVRHDLRNRQAYLSMAIMVTAFQTGGEQIEGIQRCKVLT